MSAPTPSPLPKPTLISITIKKGSIAVHPDPATVRVRTLLEWHIEAAGELPELECEIYFSTRSPFNWSAQKAVVAPRKTSIIAATPDSPGDYKYGVRATSKKDGSKVADEDPHLIVLPR